MLHRRMIALCLASALALGPATPGLAQHAAGPGVSEDSALAARKLDELSSRVLQQLGRARAQNRRPAERCLDDTLSQLNMLGRRLERLQVNYLGDSERRRRVKLRLLKERIAVLTCQASKCLPPLDADRPNKPTPSRN